MTGAQESTYERLAKRKEKLALRPGQERDGSIRVEWAKRNPWGGYNTVKAVVTPEGRVVEAP